MNTLAAPVYEVKKDSEWYKSEVRRKNGINNFFDTFKEKFGIDKGFGFYHSEYFGVHEGTEAHDYFKDEVVKNPTKNGFYPFKKRSKYYKEIKELLEQIEEVSPFKSHDVFGLNNVSGRHWVGDRWFFGVKHEQYIKGDEVVPIDYKDYLSVVINEIGGNE
jgi:hypothetical protein